MSKLRDLEADRHFLDCLCEKADAATHLWDIAEAALGEVDGLVTTFTGSRTTEYPVWIIGSVKDV